MDLSPVKWILMLNFHQFTRAFLSVAILNPSRIQQFLILTFRWSGGVRFTGLRTWRSISSLWTWWHLSPKTYGQILMNLVADRCELGGMESSRPIAKSLWTCWHESLRICSKIPVILVRYWDVKSSILNFTTQVSILCPSYGALKCLGRWYVQR